MRSRILLLVVHQARYRINTSINTNTNTNTNTGRIEILLPTIVSHFYLYFVRATFLLDTESDDSLFLLVPYRIRRSNRHIVELKNIIPPKSLILRCIFHTVQSCLTNSLLSQKCLLDEGNSRRAIRNREKVPNLSVIVPYLLRCRPWKSRLRNRHNPCRHD